MVRIIVKSGHLKLNCCSPIPKQEPRGTLVLEDRIIYDYYCNIGTLLGLTVENDYVDIQCQKCGTKYRIEGDFLRTEFDKLYGLDKLDSKP